MQYTPRRLGPPLTAAGATPRRGGQFQQAGALTLRGLLEKSAPQCAPIGSAYQRSFSAAYEEMERQKDLGHIEALFRAADTDGSGLVSYAEFDTCMRNGALFKILNRRFGFQRHETPKIFRALDINGSGSISVAEWLETCAALMQVVKEGEVIHNWRVHKVREQLKGTGQRPEQSITATPRRRKV